MTPEEVTERVLEAAEIERRMPRERGEISVRAGQEPRISGYTLPWVHSDADIKGWGKSPGDKMEKGDDPLNDEWRWKWLNKPSVRMPGSAEVTRWEEVRQWFIERLDDPAERRALWAWAASKHGGKSFASFCRKEHPAIHVETGRRRKNRAIERITASFSRKAVQHSADVPFAVLMDEAEIIYFANTVEAVAFEEKQPKRYTWRDDPSMKPLFEHGRHSSRRQRVNPQARQKRSA